MFSTCLPRNLPCLVFESNNTFLTYTWLRQTDHKHSSSFLQDKYSYISWIFVFPTLALGIVHSIIIYSTISKITVRPREIGTGGTGVTSNHDNEAHRGSDSVFYSLIWALQNEFCKASGRVSSNQRKSVDSSCARQRARSSTFIVSESLFPIRSHG